jgi:beta-galactosidase/beta-glucuronidase
MESIHPIRLRGPWNLIPLARAIRNALGENHLTLDSLPAACSQIMPADWGESLGPDFRGHVQYERAFGCPTNLDPDEEVWLVIEAVDQTATVKLNEHELGEIYRPATPWRYCVTNLLKERNQLTVTVDCPADQTSAAQLRQARFGLPGGLIGEVRLEISKLQQS